MGYQPIEDYGVVGDLHTIALVGKNGSIDWLCYPRFDSPSVFAAILDDEKGGRWKIAPTHEVSAHRQMYWPETNVLITRFLSPDGVGEVCDFMPLERKGTGNHGRLVRRLRSVRGQMSFEMVCEPAFNYARDEHEIEVSGDGAIFHSPELNLGLATRAQLEKEGLGVRSHIVLNPGDTVVFVLHGMDSGETALRALAEDAVDEVLWRTVDYWRRWLSQSKYTGRWRERVHRSALALKLLSYEPTGAIIAAPTCSLPETIGGGRNWDYRYTWIRDAAFTIYAFLRLGFTSEASAFMEWIEARARELGPGGSLQIMYGIDGRHELKEEELDHLEGYRRSGPVRIGNGAYDQLQLDIYGELLDAVYLFNKHGSPISHELWTHLCKLVDWVVANWDRKDAGIWEMRGGPRHFVYSKLMCWVALDRALRLAEKRSFPANRGRWMEARDLIYWEIMERGWNEKRQAFVQHYDSDALDAANLIMPLVFFLSPADERMIMTLDAVMQRPEEGGLASDSLVYRYNTAETMDGLDGQEGTFNIATFWLVEALTRAGYVHRDRLETARLIFEQMVGYANHLGLYAEETGPSGEALGNFPQAFTHLSLISAAYNLDRALGKAVP